MPDQTGSRRDGPDGPLEIPGDPVRGFQIGSLFLLLAGACGGLVDWEAFLSHGKCGVYSQLSYMGWLGWSLLVIGWCLPVLPLFLGPNRGRQIFFMLEAAVMAIPVAGLAVVLAMPGSVGCNEWSGMSIGILCVPILLLHIVLVIGGVIVLQILQHAKLSRRA